MPVLKIISYPAKVFQRGHQQISTKVMLQNGETFNLPRGHRYDLFRILVNRNKVIFMETNRLDVFCDEDSYALLVHTIMKRGSSSLTKQDIVNFRAMPLKQILEVAMPKVIADILLED